MDKLEETLAHHIKECGDNYKQLSNRIIWVLLAVLGTVLFQIAVKKGLI